MLTEHWDIEYCFRSHKSAEKNAPFNVSKLYQHYDDDPIIAIAEN